MINKKSRKKKEEQIWIDKPNQPPKPNALDQAGGYLGEGFGHSQPPRQLRHLVRGNWVRFQEGGVLENVLFSSNSVKPSVGPSVGSK